MRIFADVPLGGGVEYSVASHGAVNKYRSVVAVV